MLALGKYPDFQQMTLKYFFFIYLFFFFFIFFFLQKIGFDISCKLSLTETICMKCQILFYRKKINKMSISYAEFAHSIINVKGNQI